jgi:hypothetical protein
MRWGREAASALLEPEDEPEESQHPLLEPSLLLLLLLLPLLLLPLLPLTSLRTDSSLPACARAGARPSTRTPSTSPMRSSPGAIAVPFVVVRVIDGHHVTRP